jgi:hypothetical protein
VGNLSVYDKTIDTEPPNLEVITVVFMLLVSVLQITQTNKRYHLVRKALKECSNKSTDIESFVTLSLKTDLEIAQILNSLLDDYSKLFHQSLRTGLTFLNLATFMCYSLYHKRLIGTMTVGALSVVPYQYLYELDCISIVNKVLTFLLTQRNVIQFHVATIRIGKQVVLNPTLITISKFRLAVSLSSFLFLNFYLFFSF